LTRSQSSGYSGSLYANNFLCDGRETKVISETRRTGLPKGSNSKVYALCEMILEDLNNYSECMIPIGEWTISKFKMHH
jgi:nitrogen permease regulator 2-like protein